MGKPKCNVYRTYCLTHNFVHGAEAEELRSGIEAILRAGGERTNQGWHATLQRLLDRVDARDSLAWLEAREARRVACAEAPAWRKR